jgi:CheY-like chemotaxis protein
MSEKNILVIDDQPEIIEIIEEIVESAFDCEIDAEKNASTAIEKCNDKKYDLICTDYIMPGMNGGDFVKSLRNGDSVNKNTPIIIITGNEHEVEKTLGALGAVRVVNKVEDIQNLLEIFGQYLED